MKRYFRKSSRLATLVVTGLMLFACSSDDDAVNDQGDDTLVELPPIMLDCDYFNEDRVLTNDLQRPLDYVISCWSSVEGSLKIEPGVVIAFENHAGLYVNLDDNLFEIKGTATDPVILTGTSEQNGYWRGVFFADAHNPNNLIEHTIIEYAGSQNLTTTSPIYEGSLALRGVSGTDPQALTLNHVEISHGGSVGLDYHGVTKDFNVETSNLVITGNADVPVKVTAEMAHIFNNTSSYAGNARDFLNVTTSYYEIEEQSVTWQKLDVPYLVEGRVHGKKDGHLVIEAGVEMLFKPGAYLQFSPMLPTQSTSFKIQGTASDPVHLKPYNDESWGGIYWGYTDEMSSIDHAIIEKAKGDFPVGNIENTGAIYMWAKPYLTVSNTIFKDLQNCAFYDGTGYDFDNVTVSNVTFDNVAGEIYCLPE
ncbi:hypothetical protein [Winogradskyella sp. SM1960]|uniref:hypothetical protein n=1 Tax=Winogradskyella sp. SM1960 TaxID=2865955 RepID=UPI001CD5EB38|nr:hypothetical protein [Winogradskyella sp. SM1960]